MAFWEPWSGCRRYSDGCLNCYIYGKSWKEGVPAPGIVRTGNFDLPVRKLKDGSQKVKSGRVWTCFKTDFFLEDADPWRGEAWDMMRERSDLEFFMITKRIERFAECVPEDWGDGWDNVTVCCTMEDQEAVNRRMPVYRDAPIKRKIVVCEPLLGPVDLSPWLGDWVEQVVCGGESGRNVRECRYEWILSLREQCVASNVRFWFRQTGSRLVKDGIPHNIPPKMRFAQARKAGINII